MWYIVAGTTGGVNRVWSHHGLNGGEPGCWARDFDAVYNPRQFGYSRRNRAQKKAEEIANTGRGDPRSPHVYVVDRQTLFKYLDLEDWSKEIP